MRKAAYSMDYKGTILIKIEYIVKNKTVVIKIKDKGKGIDPKIIDKIFDPFYTTKPTGKGTGMGLSVVLGLVERLNGKIDVKSKLGKGTVFSITLPSSKTQLVYKKERKIDSKSYNVNLNSEYTVLIVDDNEIVLEVEDAMLNELGFITHKFLSAVEGFNYFKENIDKIDIIFSDYTMPEMNGFELISKIKKMNPNIVTVLCSGLGDTFDKKKLKDLGVDLLLPKPLKLEDMYKVSRLLNK